MKIISSGMIKCGGLYHFVFRDGDKMAINMEKITELEMGLLHLQRNIDFPEITLPVHPFVSQTIHYYSLQEHICISLKKKRN